MLLITENIEKFEFLDVFTLPESSKKMSLLIEFSKKSDLIFIYDFRSTSPKLVDW